MSLQGVSINRTKIPLTPDFATTKYKVQKATFKMAILDLQCGNSTSGRSYRLFYSIYIQLFRFQSLDGMQLPQTISLKDIDNKPNLYLQQLTAKLDV